MRERHDNLFQFFGGYFHQDWKEDDSTWEAVIERFAREADPDARERIARELDQLIAASVSDDELPKQVAALGCDYYAGSPSKMRIWLVDVANALRFYGC